MGAVEPHFSYLMLKRISLLLCRRSENCILGSLGHSEFQDGLRGDFDFLARRWIPAESSLSFLLYEFAEARNRELTLLRFPIGEISKRHNKVFDLFLADARLVGHLCEDLGLGHLCHQNPPLKSRCFLNYRANCCQLEHRNQIRFRKVECAVTFCQAKLS